VAHLSIELSGGVRCTLDGRSLPPPPRRDVVRLLAYLALHAPAAIPRSALAADLWPQLPPLRGRGNLRLILHTLQRHLAAADVDSVCLRVSPETVGWDPSLRVTVDLRQTLELVGSLPVTVDAEALTVPDGALPDWPDPWFDSWRRRFDDARGQLLAHQGALLEAAGRPAAARQAALRLLTLRPTDEAAHMRLVRIAAAEGDLAGARQQFERCCQVLEDELGQLPAAESLDLVRRLFGPPIVERATAPSVGLRASTVGMARDAAIPFIDQLGRLAQVADLSRDHRLLVLTGPAGCGKSRLLQALRERPGSAPTWVDLDGLARDGRVAAHIDRALEQAVAPGAGGLLLIDHAEAAANPGLGPLLRDRLRASPSLRLVAASRIPLLIGGERLWRVPSLLTRASAAAGRSISRSEGFAFLAAALEDLDRDAPGRCDPLEELVAALEGRPLALLAAATALRLAPDLVAQARRLATHPELLLDIPVAGARHGSLADGLAADASWLGQDALAKLPCLAGIPGSFGPAEARACMAGLDEDAVWDLLGHLARGGLLAPLPPVQGEPRFRLDPLARVFWSRRSG
jgi:DNA-binding SARP family transcriptional activator